MSTSAFEIVTLKNGHAVPRAILCVLWALEDREVTIELDADGFIVLTPAIAVAEHERDIIRQHRADVVRLLRDAAEAPSA